MRTFVATLLLVLLSQPALSQDRSMGKWDMKGNYDLRTVCIDGYKFLITNENHVRGFDSKVISVVQFYEERDGKALPAKC